MCKEMTVPETGSIIETECQSRDRRHDTDRRRDTERKRQHKKRGMYEAGGAFCLKIGRKFS